MNKLVDMVGYFNKVSNEMHSDEWMSDNEAYESILSNIDQYPHGIILMAVVDENNKDGFPEALCYEYLRVNHDFSFEALSRLNFESFQHNMLKTNLNPKPEEIEVLYNAIQTIKVHFGNSAANIWNDCPSSHILKQRLMTFDGMNPEKANLLALLLVQKFHIRLADKKDITISYDPRILATMKRIGLISSVDKSYEEIKFITRKLSPEYPGIFDSFFVMLGKHIIEGPNSDVVLNASREIILSDCVEAVNELKLQKII